MSRITTVIFLLFFVLPLATHAQAPTDIGNCVVACTGDTCTATPPAAGRGCCRPEAEARTSCEASQIEDGPTGIFSGGQCIYTTTRALCDRAQSTYTSGNLPGRTVTVTFTGGPATPAAASTPAAPTGGRYGLRNPLGTVSIPVILGRFVSAAIGLVGALFLVMLIYGGFVWMTAGGDSKKVASARKTIINAVLGILVVALSYTFVTVIFQYVAVVAG